MGEYKWAFSSKPGSMDYPYRKPYGKFTMNKLELIQSVEKPEDMSIEDELAWALSRVLEWENPSGSIEYHYIPSWLAVAAKDAIRRYMVTFEKITN